MNTTISAPAGRSRAARRDILEFTFGSATHKIDRENGVIHDVKIIGSRSRNGGHYPAATLAAAKSLYEGARVNIDHPQRSRPDQERTFGDWFGVLQNVRHASDGLYGDLAYLQSHPLASQICEAAERFPASFGLSHNAQVTEAENEGHKVYEKIHHVRSVDIVCKPATTRGIFESETAPDADDEANDDTESESGAEDNQADADDQAGDAQQDAADSNWHSLARQLLNIYVDNNRPANRIRSATELFGEMLMAESMAASAAAMPSAAVSPEANEQTPLTFGAGAAADPSLESIARVARPTAKRPLTERRLIEPLPSERPSSEKPSSVDRARAALESLGLATEPWRVVALAALSNSDDRRALIGGWITNGSASGSVGSKFRPRSAGNAIEAVGAIAAPPPTDNWDDPKLATLALLGR